MLVLAGVVARTLSAQARKRNALYLQSHWHPGGDIDGNCCVLERFGNMGDGGKQVCISDLTDEPPDTLVSIGSNDEFSFEEAMMRQFRRLNVHVYDGTVASPRVPTNVTYHNMNVRKTLQLPYLTLTSRAILKIDCEGCEYSVLPQLLRNHDNFLQILLELHVGNELSKADELMVMLNKSYAVFSSEANIASSHKCMEYSFRNRKRLRNPV